MMTAEQRPSLPVIVPISDRNVPAISELSKSESPTPEAGRILLGGHARVVVPALVPNVSSCNQVSLLFPSINIGNFDLLPGIGYFI